MIQWIAQARSVPDHAMAQYLVLLSLVVILLGGFMLGLLLMLWARRFRPRRHDPKADADQHREDPWQEAGKRVRTDSADPDR